FQSKKKKEAENDEEEEAGNLMASSVSEELSDMTNPDWEAENSVTMPPESPQVVPLFPPPVDRAPDIEAEFAINIRQLWKFFLGEQTNHFTEVHQSKGDKSKLIIYF
ncbi:unnamed protein product, partial [marine sediment metagenome]